MTIEFEMVLSSQHLCNVVDLCRQKSAVAIDTEFARFNTYYPIVGLIQIYDGDACYLIDPLEVSDLSSLKLLMLDTSVVKVLHACSEDMEVFQHTIGATPSPTFDSQIAAAMLGVGFSIGYQKLVLHYLELEIDKEETRSDWLKRPLSQSQLEYAALDVIHLLSIYKLQKQSLESLGRLTWVQDECESLPSNIATLIKPEAYYKKVKSISKLDSQQLNVLKYLCTWREGIARLKDVPRNRVIEEKSLYSISLFRLSKLETFQKSAKLSPRQIQRYGTELLQAVNMANDVDKEDHPQVIDRPKTPLSSQGMKQLKEIVASTADQLDIAPEMLAKRRHLEQLMRSLDSTGTYHLPSAFNGWRQATIGAALLAHLNN